ncbi:MAG: disulfide bond formation protein B [Pseudomonadales bacterium]
MTILAKPRSLNFIGLACCIGLIATALYMQYVQGLEPCPLCMMQRLVIYALGALFLIGALHKPQLIGQRIYATLITLVSLSGVGFASRQLWLQSLPPEEVPACGPSLEYMIDVLPWTEVLSVMMRGTGDCAEVQWTFLSLSIPGWTLIAFIFFALLGLMQWHRPPI